MGATADGRGVGASLVSACAGVLPGSEKWLGKRRGLRSHARWDVSLGWDRRVTWCPAVGTRGEVGWGGGRARTRFPRPTPDCSLFLPVSPFLLGRALWAASRFTVAMSPELIQQFLQATVSGLHETQPPSVRISAVRAIWG